MGKVRNWAEVVVEVLQLPTFWCSLVLVYISDSACYNSKQTFLPKD